MGSTKRSIDKHRKELQYLYDERSGILEYDAGLSRGEAERQALEAVKADHRR